MPFGLWKKKAQATVDRETTVDRQRQVDIGYATRRLEQGDLSLFAGSNFDESNVLSLHNISLVSERLGQTPEPVEKFAEVDRGMITITIDRIEFAGKFRHVGVSFGSIESIGHTRNGIMIAARNSANKLHFEGADRVVIALKVQDRMYRQPLSGRLLRLLLEAVIKISFERRDEI